MEPFFSPQILAALKFAAAAHKNQSRLDKTPYISHPAGVGMILFKAGYAQDVVIAGILHDVIEDTQFGYQDIARQFGKAAADLVLDVSEDNHLPVGERKQKYLAHLAKACSEAKAISAADLMTNRMDMLFQLPQGTDHWQQPDKKNLVPVLIQRDLDRLAIIKQGTNIPFIHELENVLQQVHQFFIKAE